MFHINTDFTLKYIIPSLKAVAEYLILNVDSASETRGAYVTNTVLPLDMTSPGQTPSQYECNKGAMLSDPSYTLMLLYLQSVVFLNV